MQQEFITVTFNRTKIAIRCSDILYVIMSDDYCRIHMFDENVYCCRMTLIMVLIKFLPFLPNDTERIKETVE